MHVWDGLGRRVLQSDGDVDLACLGERIVTRVKVLAIRTSELAEQVFVLWEFAVHAL